MSHFLLALALLAGGASGTAERTCASGVERAGAPTASDVRIGPLVIIGARRTRDAFNRHGYKLPVTLPYGVTATLSVPDEHIGLFTRRAQDRAWRRGVAGANRAVRFVSCAGDAAAGRSGFPGGIVVDRPRCATLTVTVEAQPRVRRRVPLGRSC
jgi:hypothetical protein